MTVVVELYFVHLKYHAGNLYWYGFWAILQFYFVRSDVLQLA